MTCACSQPGWCERHGCFKTPYWHSLCRTRPDYFELWEQQRGPGQPLPARQSDTRPLAANAPDTPADLHSPFDCIHRGDVVRHVTCRLCGNREVRVAVFSCDLHRECTLRRWSTKPADLQLARCITCADRQPDAASIDTTESTARPSRA